MAGGDRPAYRALEIDDWARSQQAVVPPHCICGRFECRMMFIWGTEMSVGAKGQMSVCQWLMIALLWLTPSITNAQTASKAMSDPRTEEAIALMMRFAERTGIDSDRPQQRYLWTDAFAVCNFLGLARATGQERYRQLALQLIDQVHHTLGQHRSDDPRTGWISGLSGQEAEAHPTRGGLRIGKRLPERDQNAPFDESLEWDRDGQYFHYLTKWMHALDQTTRSTGQPTFNVWAQELAESAHRTFTYVPPGSKRKRMYWKVSIDLSRPLVPSMGQHDPIDGYITYVQLQTTASKMPGSTPGPSVSDEAGEFASMIERGSFATTDPLGLGGLLTDAARVVQLMQQGASVGDDLLQALLTTARTGLELYVEQEDLRQSPTHRLAFRELGLAIGLHAVAFMWQAAEDRPERFPKGSTVYAQLQTLMRYAPFRTEIESFWRDPENRQTQIWAEHRDINEVMLATTLAPEGFFVLHSPP